MKTALLVILFALTTSLYGQQSTHYLGGLLDISLSESGRNDPRQQFSSSSASRFSLNLSPYWYREKGKTGLGIGLEVGFATDSRQINGEALKNTTTNLGLNAFWRYLLIQPHDSWRIWLSPRASLAYSVDPNEFGNNPGQRFYSASLDLGPTITWNLSQRFRLVFDYRLINYNYLYRTTIGEQGFDYRHALNIRLAPSAGILGVEFAL